MTIIRLGAATSSARRQGSIRRTAGPEIGVGPVDLAHRQPRHLRRGGGAAEAEAALVHPHVARDRAALAVRADRDVAGDRGLDVVAVEQLGVLGAHVEAHADAARRGEIEGARAGDGAAARRGAAELLDLQPRAAEPAGRLEILDHHAGHRALQPRAGGAHRAVDDGFSSAAAQVGADRRRAAEIDQLDAGQAPQGVGGAVVADLRRHRRPHQPLEQVARAADRRDPRLGAADRPPFAHRHRAHRRVGAVEPGVDADVDRTRRQHQAGAGEAADAQIGLAGRRRVRRGRTVADQARGDAAEAEPRPGHVEHGQRHRLQRASTSVRSPNRPARLALPPAKVKRVGASRQPSSVRVSTAGLVSSSGRRSSVPLPVIR